MASKKELTAEQKIDALRGRVWRNEVGMLGFEGFELVHALVVLRIGPGGGIEDVVEVLVVAKLFAESFDLLVYILTFGSMGGLRHKQGL